ncbi:MAG: aminotransferase class V-fold PLP-dependent enzyme [Chloroflexota bacterium]|nr:MAG: aminotransferase class V-fold PLP-dependent enzyme [Chloroflexota bacterium]
MRDLKRQFLLDPEVVFLNHGSFGATPRPVFESYQDWQRRVEWAPVQFLDDQMPELFEAARQPLADFLKVAAEDVVYIPNATFGVNVVGRSLTLGPGDEVLTTDHEYGACDRAWRFLSQKRGFNYLRQPISLPVRTAEEIVEEFWAGVTERTRLIFISHITSTTALRLPVERICGRARQAGILTLVDGAHAPGQIPLDLNEIGADFYVGNCHKWLCAPKGSGFIFTRPERQALIEPLVVGWGWEPQRTFTFGSDYLDYLQWLGTSDPAAYLAVPDAIQFQADNDWRTVRDECQALLKEALARIREVTGLEALYPDDAGFYQQMAVATLPPEADLPELKRRLLGEYRIQIPCLKWADRQLIRLSIQGYNVPADVDALIRALATLLGRSAK